MPPPLRNKHHIPPPQPYLPHLPRRPPTPHRLSQNPPLVPLHHLLPPHPRPPSPTNLRPRLEKQPLPAPRRHQPHDLGAGQLAEQVRVRVAVPGGVGRLEAHPEAGVVDVAFSGSLDEERGGEVGLELGREGGERGLGDVELLEAVRWGGGLVVEGEAGEEEGEGGGEAVEGGVGVGGVFGLGEEEGGEGLVVGG